ncbi:hypothetical protein FQN60_000711 [Etheostoma spectabile]|uniref:Uncharacterized protein n=1 Tax=Etheostoma spectabile TaxID=54343 RepID=A0A5J5D2U6_9PERO|nr:hypothetical protein FQN60_000711 [Etheostoma spectabile]
MHPAAGPESKSWESSRRGRRRDLTCRRCGSSQADAAEAVWRSAGAAGGAEALGSLNLRQGLRKLPGQYRKIVRLQIHSCRIPSVSLNTGEDLEFALHWVEFNSTSVARK